MISNKSSQCGSRVQYTLISTENISFYSHESELREVSRMRAVLLVSLLVVNSYQVTKLIIDTDMVNSFSSILR